MPNTFLTGLYGVGRGAGEVCGDRTSYHTKNNLKTLAAWGKKNSKRCYCIYCL